MNTAPIYLTPNESNPLGVIGEVPGENGETIKGHTLVDVMAQVSKFPLAVHFLFHCHGPGGDVMAGDQIYDYMESMKAEGKVVDTITDGDIGSIMTKPFMAGQTRTIGEGHKLYVHAPWVPHMEGNAKEIVTGLESLIADEERLRNFYKQKTGITEAGLQGLMAGSSSQDGTFITADQAVSLKFATKKAPSKMKAYALIKNLTMSNTLSVGQKIALAIGQAIDSVIGTPAAAAPAPAPPAQKAMVPLEMEGGMKLISSSEDPANLVGSDITDEAGQPVQDGDVPLTDGRILVVAGGKVTEVKPAAAAQAPVVAPAAAAPVVPTASAAEIALQGQVTALTEELNTLKAVDVNALVTKALDDFKAAYPGLGKAPTKAINTNGLATNDQPNGRTINAVMAQKREDRKKQINKN